MRDAALGAEGTSTAYQVRLGVFAARSREAGDARDVDAAERLLRPPPTCSTVAERIPRRGRLADLLEAWRAGLDAAGFWTALEEEELRERPSGPPATAREAAAVEVWRAFVRDARAGWKAARSPGPEMDRAAFARWLIDAAATLRSSSLRAAPGRRARPSARVAWTAVRSTSSGWRESMRRAFPVGHRPRCLGDEERQAIHGVLGRAAVPALVGSGDARSPLAEAVDRWRLGRALASAGRIAVSRRRSAGGAPADVVQRLLAVTGVQERDLSSQPIPTLAEAPGPAWARVRLALEGTVAPDLRSDAA